MSVFEKGRYRAKDFVKKILRIIFLLIIGYILIGITIIFIEERLSVFEDEWELQEVKVEQADILKLKKKK